MVWIGIASVLGLSDPAGSLDCATRRQSRLLPVTRQDRHQAILGSQFQLLNPFLFHFLGAAQVRFDAEIFELALELQMFFVQRLQLFIMVCMLADELFFSLLHKASKPAAFAGRFAFSSASDGLT